MIEEAQIVVHEGHQPDLLCDLLDAHCLSCEGVTEIDLAPAQTDSVAEAKLIRRELDGLE